MSGHFRAGFEAVVIGDACRPVDLPGTIEATTQSFRENGIAVINSDDVADR